MIKEEQYLKKRKKGRRRFAKFILILIIFIIVISFIFYSVANPAFINNIINRFKSFYSSSSDTLDNESFNQQNAISKLKESGKSEENSNISSNSLKDNENVSMTSTEKANGINFWQKIISFFKKSMEKDQNKFPSNLKIKIYFAYLGEEKKFSYEIRSIIAQDAKIAVENTVKELLKGPLKSFNYPVIPPGTKLIGVDIYENVAKINFSQEFLENSLESGILDEYVIYTIVNTVTQIPGIEGVVFLIEGKRIKIYGDIDLSIPAIRDEDYLPLET